MNNINTNAQNERRDIMKGIDVSSYQGTIDWGKVKWAGVQFAILKIIRKDLNPDKTFEQNWKGCTEAGMPIQGVYNYSYATTVGKAKTDAQRVIEVLAGRKTFVWLDVENRCQQGLGQTLIDIINTYQSEIKAAGLDFGVYTGLSFYNTYILPYANQINCPFWIARYPSTKGMTIGDDPNDAKKPAIVHSLYGWQYTSAFTCSGLNKAQMPTSYMWSLEQKIQQQQASLHPHRPSRAMRAGRVMLTITWKVKKSENGSTP